MLVNFRNHMFFPCSCTINNFKIKQLILLIPIHITHTHENKFPNLSILTYTQPHAHMHTRTYTHVHIRTHSHQYALIHAIPDYSISKILPPNSEFCALTPKKMI